MKKQFSEFFQIGFGVLLASLGLKVFLLPNGFLDGGVTGIARTVWIEYFCPSCGGKPSVFDYVLVYPLQKDYLKIRFGNHIAGRNGAF